MEEDSVEDTEGTLEGITGQGLITALITAGDTMLTDTAPFGFPAIGLRFAIPWVAGRSGYLDITDSQVSGYMSRC